MNHTRYSIDTYLLWFWLWPWYISPCWHLTFNHVVFYSRSSWLPGRAVFYAGWLSHERQTWQIPHEREAQDTGWSTTRRFGRNIYWITFTYTVRNVCWSGGNTFSVHTGRLTSKPENTPLERKINWTKSSFSGLLITNSRSNVFSLASRPTPGPRTPKKLTAL